MLSYLPKIWHSISEFFIVNNCNQSNFFCWSGLRRCWGPVRRGKSSSGRIPPLGDPTNQIVKTWKWFYVLFFQFLLNGQEEDFRTFPSIVLTRPHWRFSTSSTLPRAPSGFWGGWEPEHLKKKKFSNFLFLLSWWQLFSFPRPGMMPPFSVPDYVLPKPKVLWTSPHLIWLLKIRAGKSESRKVGKAEKGGKRWLWFCDQPFGKRSVIM